MLALRWRQDARDPAGQMHCPAQGASVQSDCCMKLDRLCVRAAVILKGNGVHCKLLFWQIKAHWRSTCSQSELSLLLNNCTTACHAQVLMERSICNHKFSVCVIASSLLRTSNNLH